MIFDDIRIINQENADLGPDNNPHQPIALLDQSHLRIRFLRHQVQKLLLKLDCLHQF